MLASHSALLVLLARQAVEHRSDAIRRVHLATNLVSWLALCTALSQISLGPVNLGVVWIVVNTLRFARVDLVVALLLAALAGGWAVLPGVPWGVGHSLWVGAVLPLAVFAGIGSLALLAHVYYHEHAPWLQPRTRGERILEVLDLISLGGHIFMLQVLLDRGWRPVLATRLREVARGQSLRNEGGAWENWGRTSRARPVVMWAVEGPEDVQAAVREAMDRDLRLRVVASGFSWPAYSSTDGVLVFTERMDKLRLAPEAGEGVVEAGAGATNRQINAFLAAHGRCLPWNVVLENVRIGGTVATGTHGSGRDTATMGDLLIAVELVDGTGTLRRFDEADGEVFSALRLALGAFGVVTRVWLRTMPMVAARCEDRRVPLRETLATLPELVARHDAVELYWFPHQDWLWLRTVDRVPGVDWRAAGPRWSERGENLFQMFLLRLGARAVRRLGQTSLPDWVGFSTRFLVWRTQLVPWPDSQHYRTWVETSRVGCVEVALPLGGGTQAFEAAWAVLQERVESWAARGLHPLNLTVNVRFVGASKALLSPAFEQPLTAWVEALCVERHAEWEAFSAELLGAWLDIPGALPHWAKEFEHLKGHQERITLGLGDRLPRFVEAIRASGVDPAKRFRNPLLDRLLKEQHA